VDSEVSGRRRRVEQTLGSNLLEIRAEAVRQEEERSIVERVDQRRGEVRIKAAA